MKVTDVNDNPPEFTRSTYEYTFSDISVTKMFTIKAKDKDLGPGGVVKFRLDGQKEVSLVALIYHNSSTLTSVFLRYLLCRHVT